MIMDHTHSRKQCHHPLTWLVNMITTLAWSKDLHINSLTIIIMLQKLIYKYLINMFQ